MLAPEQAGDLYSLPRIQISRWLGLLNWAEKVMASGSSANAFRLIVNESMSSFTKRCLCSALPGTAVHQVGPVIEDRND